METQVIGLVVVALGIVDASMSMWIPNRVADERQRTVLRYALISSGVMMVMVGALLFTGVLTGSVK